MGARKLPQLLSPGDLAPGFELAHLEGGAVTLAELLPAGPIVLAFYKVTCPVCQLTFPFLERIHAGAVLPIYAISQNDSADTRDFNAEFGLTLPTLLDTEESGFPVSNIYGISHVPTMFLIGLDGKVERVIEGWNREEIEMLGESVGVRVIQPGDNVPAWKSG
jgi:peroxiredoxin